MEGQAFLVTFFATEKSDSPSRAKPASSSPSINVHESATFIQTCQSGIRQTLSYNAKSPKTGSKRSTLLVATLLLGFLVVRHEPPLLVHLTVGQSVLLALVGVLTALVLDADRRADQPEYTTVGILEIARVGLGYRIDLVAVNHDDRRVRPPQVRIAQLDAAAGDHRRLVFAHCILEDLRQAAGRP